ncbi:MAG: hypothetical protein KZQ93_16625 [Candidatus Thiodiazotropha sp. (ex Monitilora ramsayi)]|nr:hypothetical protein [Candidatus Thiodiazotropha sp. (ex Monitilora ramsayi)]
MNMQAQRYFIVLLGLMIGSYTMASDWRHSDSADQKLQNLIDALPGTSHWMFEVGERYNNLYWAAKQGKWEFAEYQVEEIEKLVQLVQLTRPKRAATAQEFLDSAIPPIKRAVESRQWNSFKFGFGQLSIACMHCHVQNDHAFITLPPAPKGASSPVLNMGATVLSPPVE